LQNIGTSMKTTVPCTNIQFDVRDVSEFHYDISVLRQFQVNATFLKFRVGDLSLGGCMHSKLNIVSTKFYLIGS